MDKDLIRQYLEFSYIPVDRPTQFRLSKHAMEQAVGYGCDGSFRIHDRNLVRTDGVSYISQFDFIAEANRLGFKDNRILRSPRLKEVARYPMDDGWFLPYMRKPGVVKERPYDPTTVQFSIPSDEWFETWGWSMGYGASLTKRIGDRDHHVARHVVTSRYGQWLFDNHILIESARYAGSNYRDVVAIARAQKKRRDDAKCFIDVTFRNPSDAVYFKMMWL